MTIVTVVAAVAASSALAAGPSALWRKKDMTTAVKGLGYPKPHPKTLSCKGLGTMDSAGRFASFRCAATYRHHVRKVFFTRGDGIGGWICAGPKAIGCKLLRHGFATTQMVADSGGPSGAAEFAAQGYVQNHYGVPADLSCGALTQTGTLTWQKCYQVSDTQTATVTVTLKAARGGYVTSGSSS